MPHAPHSQASTASKREGWARFRRRVREFQWFHLGVGIFGNVAFFIGSICFFYEDAIKTAGIWLFVLGALGMTVDSLGQTIVKFEETRPHRSVR